MSSATRNMTKQDYETYAQQEDWQLLGYTEDKENSPRRHTAQHILEMRRIQKSAVAAQRAATAARWSAIAAIVSALAAIIALFRH